MPSKQLFVVRIGLLTGILLFAGIAMSQRRGGAVPEAMANLPVETLRYILWVCVGVAILAALFLRSRVESAPPVRKALITLTGWSIGEGVALLGIILHFAGADVSTLALGILAFVVALMLLPVPRERR